MRISGKERDFYDSAVSYDTSTDELHCIVNLKISFFK